MSNFDLTFCKVSMLKGGLVLIWELNMNLVPTLLDIGVGHFMEQSKSMVFHTNVLGNRIHSDVYTSLQSKPDLSSLSNQLH